MKLKIPILYQRPAYPFGSVISGRSWTEPSHTGAYKFGFNGKDKVDEIQGDGNAYDFGARIYDSRLGRWMSLDPLMKKYPDMSPYAYCKNNSIIYVDKEGKDNIIYLVVLPSSLAVNGGKLTVKDINNMIEQSNANFEKLGLKTRVAVYNRDVNENTFDPKKLDKTDAVAVLGSKDAVCEFATKKIDKKLGQQMKNGFPQTTTEPGESPWDGGCENPEKSQHTTGYGGLYSGGKVIGIDANGVECFASKIGMEGDKSEKIKKSGGHIICHGAGHNAGLDHALSELDAASPKANKDRTMFDAELLKDSYHNYKYTGLYSKGRNMTYIAHMSKRFGTNAAKANIPNLYKKR